MVAGGEFLLNLRDFYWFKFRVLSTCSLSQPYSYSCYLKTNLNQNWAYLRLSGYEANMVERFLERAKTDLHAACAPNAVLQKCSNRVKCTQLERRWVLSGGCFRYACQLQAKSPLFFSWREFWGGGGDLPDDAPMATTRAMRAPRITLNILMPQTSATLKITDLGNFVQTSIDILLYHSCSSFNLATNLFATFFFQNAHGIIGLALLIPENK